MKVQKFLVLSTGFALFSMFFGSGNLVFPIIVGQSCSGHFLLAILGIFITGVFVPFLGLTGISLYKGNLQDFLSILGPQGFYIFPFFALALMGPFGVMARCLTVAHGALIVLTSLFADFLNDKITNKKMGNSFSIIITLGIGFFVSTFDFAAIAHFLGPVLEAIYPALIALTVWNILRYYRRRA